jgi:hypothetical protein
MFSIKRAAGLAIILVLALFSSVALGAQSEVSLVHVAGSRTLAVKSLGGDGLTALSMGSAREAPFLVNVTDLAYDRQDFYVTSRLSNLYRYDPVADAWFCGDAVPSSSLEIQFLVSPVIVRDVAAIAQPVLDFSAEITGVLAATLGLDDPTTILTPVTENLQSFTTSTVSSGLEDTLPLKVTSGTGGAFTNRMPHDDCADAGASTPTPVVVQDGSISNNPTLFDWVQNVSDTIFDDADTGGDGALSTAEAVAADLVEDPAVDAAIRDALITLGVAEGLITSTVIGQVKALLTSANDTITEILGQTGSYTSLPKIVADVPGGTPSGLYKGEMTITLVEPAS